MKGFVSILFFSALSSTFSCCCSILVGWHFKMPGACSFYNFKLFNILTVLIVILCSSVLILDGKPSGVPME